MDNRYVRGLVAGVLATGILSVCMAIKSAAGIVPQANAIETLTKVSAVWLHAPRVPWAGWLEHFFIGSVLWGLSFAFVEPWLPGPAVRKGLIFCIGAWIVMMVLLLPAAGAGFFGVKLGYGAPLATLVLHLIWGFSLGLIYGFLTPRRIRVKVWDEDEFASPRAPHARETTRSH
jgi:uncharacterized membrane protein YagU involved in acid resistance